MEHLAERYVILSLPFPSPAHAPHAHAARLRHMVPPSVPQRRAAATGLDSVLYSFHPFLFFLNSFSLTMTTELYQFWFEVWTSLSPDLTDDRVTTITDWQDEHPPAPSHLRVLYLGKVLQDDETLTRTCVV